MIGSLVAVLVCVCSYAHASDSPMLWPPPRSHTSHGSEVFLCVGAQITRPADLEYLEHAITRFHTRTTPYMLAVQQRGAGMCVESIAIELNSKSQELSLEISNEYQITIDRGTVHIVAGDNTHPR